MVLEERDPEDNDRRRPRAFRHPEVRFCFDNLTAYIQRAYRNNFKPSSHVRVYVTIFITRDDSAYGILKILSLIMKHMQLFFVSLLIE